MKNCVLIFIALIFTLNLKAQQTQTCGTPPIKSEWLKNYQANPDTYAKAGDTTLYVPVTVHITGTDAGTGYYPIEDIFRNFCQLNEDFEPLGIRFYIEGDLNYINNSAWYAHETFEAGTLMMELNKRPGTLNSFIVQGAAVGAGGYYNFVSDAVAMTMGSMNTPMGHIWTHELGHYFSLMHTFLGWESIVYNPNEPTPETVSGWFSPRPVERVDGSNCTVAADGFCDTPPDYLSEGGFDCSEDGFSVQLLKDPDSIFFRADGGNYMSYARDICNSYFSPEQQAAVRANLVNNRQDLLTNQIVIDTPVTASAIILEPTENETVVEAPTLEWMPVENANRYYFEISRLSNFSPSFRVREGIVSGTSTTVYGLDENINYHWRVRPFNTTYPCEGEFTTSSFMTGEGMFTDVQGVEVVNDLVLYPNIVSAGKTARLEVDLDEPVELQIYLIDAKGRKVSTLFRGKAQGNFLQDIQTTSLSTGLYWLAIQVEGVWVQRKMLIFD